MAKLSREPSEVISSIAANSDAVGEAATALTARIIQFQDYAAAIRGRTTTWHRGSHPLAPVEDENDPFQLVLCLHKSNGKWFLSWAEERPSECWRESQLQPLVNAPIEIKIAAIGMFPDLLTSIEYSQQVLVKRIQTTIASYDAFEARLPKGGK